MSTSPSSVAADPSNPAPTAAGNPDDDLIVPVGGQAATVAPTGGASTADLGSLAAVLQAGFKRLEADSTKTFPVPGWPDMRIVAKKIREDERDQGETTVATIALATDKVQMRRDGDWVDVQHGWRGIATLMGDDTLQTTEVIRKVLDNGVRLDAFATRIVGWMLGRQDEIERALGE